MAPSTRRLLWIGAAAGVGYGLRALVKRNRARAFPLVGKTVFITGGSRGLGLLLARRFGAEGARVVICSRRPDALDRAMSDLTARGVDAMAIACDVTSRAEVRAAIDQARDHFGPVDVLVNNAGIIQVGPVHVMSEDDFRAAMDVHFWGSLNTIMEALPDMRARRTGRIVNITSVGGRISAPHMLPYNASKFALVGLSEGLRAELARDGILVTTVSPGLMRTGSHIQAYIKGNHRAEFTIFSLMDGLPLTSMSADCAARRIVSATRAGDPEVVLPLQAQVGVLLKGLFPGAATETLAMVNRVLPRGGTDGHEAVQGKDIQALLSPSILTALIDRAALENNEASPGDARDDQGAGDAP